MTAPLLRVRDLDVTIRTETGPALAVTNAAFDLHPGEMLALVGGSGSGKSVTALALMRLLPAPPARITRGIIEVGGTDLLALDARGLEDLRGRVIGMIFQEPMTSLNPVLSIESQMTEGLVRHFGLRGRDTGAGRGRPGGCADRRSGPCAAAIPASTVGRHEAARHDRRRAGPLFAWAARLAPRSAPRPPRDGRIPATLPTVAGSVPPLNARPSGCPFRDRCPRQVERCAAEMPPLAAVAAGHDVACWRPHRD